MLVSAIRDKRPGGCGVGRFVGDVQPRPAHMSPARSPGVATAHHQQSRAERRRAPGHVVRARSLGPSGQGYTRRCAAIARRAVRYRVPCTARPHEMWPDGTTSERASRSVPPKPPNAVTSAALRARDAPDQTEVSWFQERPID